MGKAVWELWAAGGAGNQPVLQEEGTFPFPAGGRAAVWEMKAFSP